MLFLQQVNPYYKDMSLLIQYVYDEVQDDHHKLNLRQTNQEVKYEH